MKRKNVLLSSCVSIIKLLVLIAAAAIVSLAPDRLLGNVCAQTTSVQPRLRPKPSASAGAVPFIVADPKVLPSFGAPPDDCAQNEPGSSCQEKLSSTKATVLPSDLGFTDLGNLC
ncbi:unnamed protein product [Cylicostephanus goldi]|uniref:Uncharacterized protein n=1 Tax=Cylicostephanus goldi TaxID=71465 RepID=A0A3P7NNQ9_CYLGO|nr:unnamed protein product [Cylicostephanus goldi]